MYWDRGDLRKQNQPQSKTENKSEAVKPSHTFNSEVQNFQVQEPWNPKVPKDIEMWLPRLPNELQEVA